MEGPLASLLEEVRRCTLCAADLPHGPRPVLQYDPRASILIAAQAPGRRVHASGKPFADASGDRLREWLGVDVDTFYDPRRIAILPMGFCYPGTGGAGDLPPQAACAPAWRARLLASLVNLELVLVIGRYALDWHLPNRRRDSVSAIVRDWRAHWPALVPLPHPSPRNNRWLREHPWFERELLPVLRERILELTTLPVPPHGGSHARLSGQTV
jgi:uracil-DNA glycosylase